jgi:hypothetical protein
MRTLVTLFAAAAVAAAAAAPARAADCDTLGLPNPVYLQIGDTQQPLIKILGRALRDNTPRPITLIYITSDSCTNIAATRGKTPVKVTMSYVPSTLENAGWKPSDPPLTCSPPGGAVVPDIFNSNVFIGACDPAPMPDTVATVEGAAQAYVLAVPKASSQTVITAEEAYFLFGFGATKGAMAPWLDSTEIYVRNITASTLLAWAYNVNVLPAIKFKGNVLSKSTDVVRELKNAPDPEAAIGILGDEVLEANSTSLNALAFRAFGQYHAYWPGSTATSQDKQNIRDGHYTVWSPTVYMYYVQAGTQTPASADAKYVVDLIAGRAASPAPAFDPAGFVVDVGLVPLCAMKVTRSVEGGQLSLYDPAEPCGCYFDSRVGKTPACAACDSTTPCASGTCRHGYCEAK